MSNYKYEYKTDKQQQQPRILTTSFPSLTGSPTTTGAASTARSTKTWSVGCAARPAALTTTVPARIWWCPPDFALGSKRIPAPLGTPETVKATGEPSALSAGLR